MDTVKQLLASKDERQEINSEAGSFRRSAKSTNTPSESHIAIGAGKAAPYVIEPDLSKVDLTGLDSALNAPSCNVNQLTA